VFLGHYAVALAAKRAAPRTSLGTLFLSVQLADMLWPVFLLTGWERVRIVPNPDPFLNFVFDTYPISHSLLTLVAWGVVFALLYRMRTGYARGAIVVALGVVSHWVLDVVVHRPDMPLYPGGPKLGLGLWNSVTGTVVIEGLMLLASLRIYLGTTRARDGVGRYGFFALLVVVTLSYVASIFSPPPPSTLALSIGGIVFGWLFVGWAAWADKHREAVYSS
jgi:membrane-bound metal-dependent hydrolase YbcI (DUF457 family)